MIECKRKRLGGQTLVETALVILPFVLTLLGAFDVGQVLFLYATFHERARAGVRYAVVHSYDEPTIQNFVVYNSATPAGPRLFGLQTTMVTVTRYDQGTENDRIEVKISDYPVRFFSPLLSRFHLQPVFRSTMLVESLGATD